MPWEGQSLGEVVVLGELCRASVSKWALAWGRSRVGSEEQPGWYRVMDDLEFGLDIHELAEGEWKPYRQGFPIPG